MLLLFAFYFSWVTRVDAHPEIVEQIDGITTQIQVTPKDGLLFLRRGQLHGLHNEGELALADFQRAEELGTTLSEVLLARGNYYLQQRDFANAERELRLLVAKYPQHAGGRISYARVLLEKHLHLEAADELSSAVELAAQPSPGLFLAQADALTSAGPAYYDRAIAVLDRGLSRIGPIPSLQLKAVEIEELAGRPEGAVRRLEGLAKSAARKESYYLRLGELYLRNGNTTASVAAASAGIEAIKTLPERVQAIPATQQIHDKLLRLRNNVPVSHISNQ